MRWELVLVSACTLCVDASFGSLRAHLSATFANNKDLVESANFGLIANCPSGYAVNGMCGSGRNRDCGDASNRNINHQVWCKKVELSRRENDDVGGRFGEWVQCHNGEVITGICASGENPDCGKQQWTVVRCASLDRNKFTLDPLGNIYKCSSFGEQAMCDEGYVATQICTSGRNADCRGGCRQPSFNGVVCTPLRPIDRVTEIQTIGSWESIGNTDVQFESRWTVTESEQLTERQETTFRTEFSIQIGGEMGLNVGVFSFKGGHQTRVGFSRESRRQLATEIGSEVASTKVITCRSPPVNEFASMHNLDSSQVRRFRWVWNSHTNLASLRDQSCHFRLTSGPVPQCPFFACRDVECQRCCTTQEDGKEVYTHCPSVADEKDQKERSGWWG